MLSLQFGDLEFGQAIGLAGIEVFEDLGGVLSVGIVHGCQYQARMA